MRKCKYLHSTLLPNQYKLDSVSVVTYYRSVRIHVIIVTEVMK